MTVPEKVIHSVFNGGVMQREIVFDAPEIMLDELKSAGIDQVVMREINEHRPFQTGPGSLEVRLMKRVDILAYRHAAIYRCRVDDTDFEELALLFSSEGIHAERRNGNIT